MNPATGTPNDPMQHDHGAEAHVVYFKKHGVQPPATLYVERDDLIRVTIASFTNGGQVTLSLRWLSPEGDIVPEQFTLGMRVFDSNPVVTTFDHAEGFLLSAEVNGPPFQRGSIFVVVDIQRGRGTGDTATGGVLIEGYMPGFGGLGYPNGRQVGAVDGRGQLNSTAVGNPAAGADFSIVVPANQHWILRGVTATLTTAVAVANRFPTLAVQDSAPGTVILSPVSQIVAASLVSNCSWFNGAIVSPALFANTGGLPAELRVPTGFTIKSLTLLLQAADQWSNIRLYFEQFQSPT